MKGWHVTIAVGLVGLVALAYYEGKRRTGSTGFQAVLDGIPGI